MIFLFFWICELLTFLECHPVLNIHVYPFWFMVHSLSPFLIGMIHRRGHIFELQI